MEPVLNLELLRTFVAVARTGELKQAADLVYRSQGAVSMQIKRLEEQVGNELMRRNNRGVELTEAGKTLLSYSEQLLQLSGAALSALSQHDLSGQLRFGIPTDYAQNFLNFFMPVLAREVPNLEARITCDRSRTLRKKLAAGELDIAIVSGEADSEKERQGSAEVKDSASRQEGAQTSQRQDQSRYLSQDRPQETLLWTEQQIWVAPAHLKLEEQQPLPIAMFDDNCIVRDLILQHLNQQNIRYKTVFTSTVLDNVAYAVTSGMGISLLPESLFCSHQMRKLSQPQFPEAHLLKINMLSSKAMDDTTLERVSRCFKLAAQAQFQSGVKAA